MKRLPGTRKYTILLETEVVDELEELFGGYGIARNEIIRTLLKRVLKALKDRSSALAEDELITLSELIDLSIKDI